MFVDEFTCIGCRNCTNVCGKTFQLEDEYGRARVISQAKADLDTKQEAIDTCPVSDPVLTHLSLTGSCWCLPAACLASVSLCPCKLAPDACALGVPVTVLDLCGWRVFWVPVIAAANPVSPEGALPPILLCQKGLQWSCTFIIIACTCVHLPAL